MTYGRTNGQGFSRSRIEKKSETHCGVRGNRQLQISGLGMGWLDGNLCEGCLYENSFAVLIY